MLKDSLLEDIKKATSTMKMENLGVGCTAKELAKKYNVKRNTVSHYLNQLIGTELFKINTRPVCFIHKKTFEEKFFRTSRFTYDSIDELLAENNVGKAKEVEVRKNLDDSLLGMIGAKGSLKKPIEQIKTSVFYPNSSLTILLHGPTGVGKSYIAKQIYNFSVRNEILKPNSPFITLNCAQYANNPELLSSILFGHIKGAFTGAHITTKGLIESADGGMLFLDEVHRLNSESQEKLFIFLDQGIYRRIGENDVWHKANVRIIMATTEDLESNFLETFLRRIPIVVNIPSLEDRGYQEKLEFIYQFFLNESKVLDRNIKISGNVIEALVLHKYNGNVGELQNSIKYICAALYARYKGNNQLEINLSDLTEHILKEIAERNENKIKKRKDILITPKTTIQDILQQKTEEENIYDKLFLQLSSLYKELKKDKIAKEQFERKAALFINKTIDTLIYNQTSENDSMLMKYVVNSVQEAFRYTEYSYNVKFGGNSLHAIVAYFFYLSNNPAVLQDKNKLSKGFIEYVMANYSKEMQIAKRIMDMLSFKMDILPNEESLIPLAFYFRSLHIKNINNRPRAIILAHGYATASSIANVANRLLEENIFEAVDMPLNKTIDDVIEWVIDYIKYNDISNGILLLVDTGSLKNVYQSLESVIKVPIAIINNVSTQLALNTGQMIKNDFNLVDIIKKSKNYNYTDYKIIYPKKNKQKAIITCCYTGMGTAEQIKSLLEESMPDGINIKVISCDYNQLKKTGKENSIFQGYEIIGIVGTDNPEIEEVEYIALDELVSGNAEIKMTRIFAHLDKEKFDELNNNIIHNFSLRRLIENLTILDTDKVIGHIEGCLREYEILSNSKISNNKKISILIHVGCLIERLIRRSPIEQYPNKEKFQQCQEKQIELIKKSFSGIEEAYSVKIPIAEIGYIYDILNKL